MQFMALTGDADDVGLLLDEAAYRLRYAGKYDPLDDPRGLCENAHDAIEFSLNAVIVATGRPYRRTHDLVHLVDTAVMAGRALPPTLAAAKALPRYTGGGRYEFRTTATREPVSKAGYDHAVALAEATLQWASGVSAKWLYIAPPWSTGRKPPGANRAWPTEAEL